MHRVAHENTVIILIGQHEVAGCGDQQQHEGKMRDKRAEHARAKAQICTAFMLFEGIAL